MIPITKSDLFGGKEAMLRTACLRQASSIVWTKHFGYTLVCPIAWEKRMAVILLFVWETYSNMLHTLASKIACLYLTVTTSTFMEASKYRRTLMKLLLDSLWINSLRTALYLQKKHLRNRVLHLFVACRMFRKNKIWYHHYLLTLSSWNMEKKCCCDCSKSLKNWEVW